MRTAAPAGAPPPSGWPRKRRRAISLASPPASSSWGTRALINPSGWRPSLVPRRPAARAAAPPPPPAAAAVGAAPPAPADPALPPGAGPVVVWFKRDLRVDDHPGLAAAAASGRPVVPLLALDPGVYAELAGSGPAAAAFAAAAGSLRAALRARGSDLLVRVGPWAEVLPAVAAAAGAGAAVVAEREAETAWRAAAEAAAAACGGGAAAAWWSAPLFGGEYGDDFRAWRGARGAPLPPAAAPAALPPPPAAGALADRGALPPAAEVARLCCEAAGYAPPPPRCDSDPDGGGDDGDDDAAWEASAAGDVAASEAAAAAALAAYFRASSAPPAAGAAAEGPACEWAPRLAPALERFDGPATPLGCFPAIFSRALDLGVLSPRRVYAAAGAALAAAPPEWAPPRAMLSLRGLAWLLASGGGAAARLARRRRAAAAAAAAEARDFHAAMAAARDGAAQRGGATLRHWRWRGALTDFLVAEPAGAVEGPAGRPTILLVHGFGAWGGHYRDNIPALAAAGFRVLAPTLPGYGRSEKPAARYGQRLWTEFLADFVARHARGARVVAVGNSIGGFMCASLAADVPGTVAGLVLVNSAGQLVDDGAHAGGGAGAGAPPPAKKRRRPPPRAVVDGVSAALFSYLEAGVAKQLARLYPTAPGRADAALAAEIARAARDPGALAVFRSVFYLPRPRPLNRLVADAYGGPTLVLQGVRDPLNDAGGRAARLAALCPNVAVARLDAGHCPMDELPEEWNAALLAWLARLEAAGWPRGAAGV